MSKASAPRAQMVPIGIPVSPPPKVERPTPKRKAARSPRGTQIPWLWVVCGGSVAWAILIMSVGLCSERRAPAPASEPEPIVQPVAVASVAAPELPSPTPLPDLVPDDAVPELPKPALPVRPMANPNEHETLLLLETPPYCVKLAPPATLVDVAPAKPMRRIVDTNVFASCEKVGTDVLFMKNPVDAFARAAKEKKLVFFIHLSGNLEDPGFT